MKLILITVEDSPMEYQELNREIEKIDTSDDEGLIDAIKVMQEAPDINGYYLSISINPEFGYPVLNIYVPLLEGLIFIKQKQQK